MKFRLALVALLAGLASCSTGSRSIEERVDGTGRSIADTLSLREFRDDAPIELQTKGAISVEVGNFGGDVLVRANPKHTVTTVEVRRVSTMGIGRHAEAREGLDAISWTAVLEPRAGGTGEVLKIESKTSSPEPHFFRAEITVTAPALDAVTVRTREGSVWVVENQGSVDIETSRGDVRMLTPWPMTQPVKIVTSQGSIDFRVRGESKGAFDCESFGGEVRQRCEFGRWRALVKGTDHDTLIATLNDGTNPIYMRTSEKNIRVAVVPDPTNVGREIVDP